MARIITETEQEDLWETAEQLGHVTCRMDEFEEVLEWKSPYSQHYERNICFRSGLSIDIHDSKHQQEIGYKDYHPEPFLLTLSFNLAGTLGELTYGIRDDFYYVCRDRRNSGS